MKERFLDLFRQTGMPTAVSQSKLTGGESLCGRIQRTSL